MATETNKTIKFSVSTLTKAFSHLASKRYETKTEALILGDQPAAVIKIISLLGDILNVDLTSDKEAVLGKATSHQGGFKRLYGPVVAKADNKAVLSILGQQVVLDKSLFKERDIELNGSKVATEFAIKQENYTGLGDEYVLSIAVYLEKSETFIYYTFPIRFADYEALEELDETQIHGYAKRSTKSFVELLGDVPEDDFFDGPTLSLNQLPLGTYVIESYRVFPVEKRVSSIMRISVESDATYWEDALKRGEEEPISIVEAFDEEDPFKDSQFRLIEVWGNKSVTSTLQNDPIITEEFPGELIVSAFRITKDNKVPMTASVIAGKFDTDVSMLDGDLDFEI